MKTIKNEEKILKKIKTAELELRQLKNSVDYKIKATQTGEKHVSISKS